MVANDKSAASSRRLRRSEKTTRRVRGINATKAASVAPQDDTSLQHTKEREWTLRSKCSTSSTEDSQSVNAADDSELKSCLKVKTQSHSLLLLEEKKNISSRPRKTRQKKAKRVEFSTIEARVYPIILGDNPSITCGPPLSLDWYQDDKGSVVRVDVDNFESQRGPRRAEKALRISEEARTDLLRRVGYDISEIHRATAAAMRCQRGRDASKAESSVTVHLKHGREAVQRKLQRWILQAPSDKVLYNQWKEQCDTVTCSAK